MNLADRILTLLPATIALALVACTALPIEFSGMTLTPHVTWLMTLAMAMLYPAAWPAWFAFALGLVQDIAYALPLGATGTLAVLMLMTMRSRSRRLVAPALRIVWLEAVVTLLVMHFLLWLVLAWVEPSAPPLVPLLLAGGISALWFPIFYLGCQRLVEKLP